MSTVHEGVRKQSDRKMWPERARACKKIYAVLETKERRLRKDILFLRRRKGWCFQDTQEEWPEEAAAYGTASLRDTKNVIVSIGFLDT